MLHLLTGPARSGKSEAIFGRMKALADGGQASLLIVPESDSHQAERRLLAVCGNRGGRLAAVTTFSKLARNVLEEAGLRPKVLDAGGRVLHMYKALTACQNALSYFKGAPRPHLIARLLETQDELTAGRVTPGALLEAAEKEGLPDKLRDLGIIFSAYSARLRDSSLETRDPFDMACDLMLHSPRLKGVHLFVDGFSGFTAQRRAALGHCLSRCKSLSVALLLGADETLFTQQAKTRHQLLRLAERAGVPVEAHVFEGDNTSLAALAAGAFDYGVPATSLPQGAAELYTCLTAAEECELAAILARRWVLEDGVRARHIALVCADLDTYGPLLENAFARYGVPLFLSQPEDVLQKPPVAAVLGVLEALGGGLTTQSVMAWLKTGLAGVPEADRDVLENYALTWNLRGNAWLRPFTLTTTGYRNPAADEAGRLARLEGIRVRVAGRLEALRTLLAPCETGGRLAAALGDFLAQSGFPQALEARMAALHAAGQPRQAYQYAQLWGIVQGALEQLGATLAHEPMALADFIRLLRLCLGQYSVDTIPASLDAAVACPFQRLPQGRLDHVVILGGREGLLPPRQGGGGLLSESERIRLEGAGIVLTQSAEEMAFEAQSYIYRALASGGALTITVPQISGDGEPCRPSFVLRRIAALAGLELQSGRPVVESGRLSAPVPAFETACRAHRAPRDASAAAARARLMTDPRQAARLESVARWAAAPRAPIRDPRLIRGIYGQRLTMTASRVERIAACRFSYFMQYGLRAEPRREARFGAPEIGTFVHEVVEKTIRTLCRDREAGLEATVRHYADGYMAQALGGKAVTARLKGIFNTLISNVLTIVRNVWEEIEAGDFRPLWFELDFSDGGDLPPLTIEAEGGVTAVIRGKIDRVDGWVSGDTLYLKVIDYKTGRKAFRLSDIYYGLNLQMFLYLSMLSRAGVPEALGREGLKVAPGAALYIPAKAPWAAVPPWAEAEDIKMSIDKELCRVGIVLSDSPVLEALERTQGGKYRFLPVSVNKSGGFSKSSSLADAQQMGALLRRTESALAKLAAEIGGGSVEANPYRTGRDFTACTWCEYRSACHFDPSAGGDRYRYLKPMKDAEVFDRLREEG